MNATTLPDLIENARRLTAKRGGKSALARALDVDRQRVSAWLSGSAQPSGEMALKLREWVAEAEAKPNKKAGRAATRPARATQASNSNTNEKAKPDRRRS